MGRVFAKRDDERRESFDLLVLVGCNLESATVSRNSHNTRTWHNTVQGFCRLANAQTPPIDVASREHDHQEHSARLPGAVYLDVLCCQTDMAAFLTYHSHVGPCIMIRASFGRSPKQSTRSCANAWHGAAANGIDTNR